MTTCTCGRRLIHLDAAGAPLDVPVCVYSGKVDCDAESLQMTFEDVVEYELQPGDPEYTLWLAQGKPVLDAPAINAYRRTGRVDIDTLPGL